MITSRGRQLLDAAWLTLLAEHEIHATHSPFGGPVTDFSCIDNGHPDVTMLLALNVTGVTRVISATRGVASFEIGDAITIDHDSYSIIRIDRQSDQAVQLYLGGVEIAGRQ